MQCLHTPRRALSAALLPFVISTWSATAQAGPYEDGMAALDRWDATRAAAFFEIAAQNGDPRGLYEFAIHATGGPSDDELLYLERAVALGEPRAMARLAKIQLRAVPGGSGRARAFSEPPSRVPRLLATACEKQQFDACRTLAELHAGSMPEWAKHVGVFDVDMAQARRWGDLWRAGRLPDALTLARRIATFEAAHDQYDTETIAAFGRYVAAEAMAEASDPYSARRPWGGELGKVTAVATREMAVFHKHLASTHRKLGLDIETWLPGRLVATFTPT